MTETTTPSVEGDRLEEIARLVDPAKFEALAFSLENVERTIKPEHWDERKAAVRSRFDAILAPIYDTARQIAALGAVAEAEAALVFYACGGLAWTYWQDGEEETGQVTDQGLDPSPALIEDQGQRA